MKHSNVALFIPNNGCRNACSFCSQRSITGKLYQPTPDDVTQAAETALRSLGSKAKEAEIAFFGGSFTAIERSYMLSLLETAASYVKNGLFSGIRISTRPDAVDSEILDLLKFYGVTTIELGAQSMDDSVLALNRRGHTALQVAEASDRIQKAGFALGLQMMTGLFGDTDEGARRTAERIAALKPDCVRIYPTIVLKDTLLGEKYLAGEYRPQKLEEAVTLCADLLDFFDAKGIPVIRLGLHASPELERDKLAGPWHPAFRELCESSRMLRKIARYLSENHAPHGSFMIHVNPRFVSITVGQKKNNLHALEALGYSSKILPDVSVAPYDFQIEPLSI